MRIIWAVFLGLFSSIVGYASSVAITDVATPLVATSSGDQLYGWFFTAQTDIFISHLGVFDEESNGLAVAHDVGIYRVVDQFLMGSAIVPEGVAGTFLDGYRYTPVTPIFLASGQYVVVMTMPDSNLDGQMIYASNVTIAPEIVWTGAAFDAKSALSYPTLDATPFQEGMFGPNFLFDVAGIQAPEPSMFFLLPCGLLVLALSKRTERSAAR